MDAHLMAHPPKASLRRARRPSVSPPQRGGDEVDRSALRAGRRQIPRGERHPIPCIRPTDLGDPALAKLKVVAEVDLLQARIRTVSIYNPHRAVRSSSSEKSEAAVASHRRPNLGSATRYRMGPTALSTSLALAYPLSVRTV